MTPDELTALVQEKDVAKLVAALENLSDKERQALAKTAVQLRKLAKKECDSLLQDPLNLSSRDHRLREVSRLAHRSDQLPPGPKLNEYRSLSVAGQTLATTHHSFTGC